MTWLQENLSTLFIVDVHYIIIYWYVASVLLFFVVIVTLLSELKT